MIIIHAKEDNFGLVTIVLVREALILMDKFVSNAKIKKNGMIKIFHAYVNRVIKEMVNIVRKLAIANKVVVFGMKFWNNACAQIKIIGLDLNVFQYKIVGRANILIWFYFDAYAFLVNFGMELCVFNAKTEWFGIKNYHYAIVLLALISYKVSASPSKFVKEENNGCKIKRLVYVP